MHDDDGLIHITIPGSPDDPRLPKEIDGVRIHYAPPLHPDDIDMIDGIPVTSVSRTLIDLAEDLPEDELRECFANAQERGLLDMDALHASRERIEWRPSLPMLDAIIAELEQD